MNKKTIRKKRMVLPISEKKYKHLLSVYHRKKLSKSLYVKYCKCLKKFKFKNKEKIGYPVCMNTVYKKRKIKPPKNASKQCNVLFKNIV